MKNFDDPRIIYPIDLRSSPFILAALAKLLLKTYATPLKKKAYGAERHIRKITTPP
jgi:hypothetical protein